MAKRFEVEVEGAKATFSLRDDIAPKTAAAFWESLPLEVELHHGKLSGDACYFEVSDGSALTKLPQKAELGLASIYKGWLAAFPYGESTGKTEVLISYGLAEYRWPTGRRHITPFAEAEGDTNALNDKFRSTRAEGYKKVNIRQVGE
jgi:hypothetical protein